MRCGVGGGGCFTSHSLPTRYRMMIMRACVCHTKPLIQHLAAHTVQHQKRARARVKKPTKNPVIRRLLMITAREMSPRLSVSCWNGVRG